jgi:hypothetical protein
MPIPPREANVYCLTKLYHGSSGDRQVRWDSVSGNVQVDYVAAIGIAASWVQILLAVGMALPTVEDSTVPFCHGSNISVRQVDWIPGLSTVEAEYMAATQNAKEAIWERRLLMEIGRLELVKYEPSGHTGTVLIRTDNQGALDLAKNPEFHDKTKHIDIQEHWIREVLEAKKITLEHVP